MKTFSSGDRVTVLKSPAGADPDYLPSLYVGTVVGLLEDVDLGLALMRAIMDDSSDTDIGETLEAWDVEGGQGLLAKHPYYVVDLPGVPGAHAYRPDELELGG